MDCLHTRDAGGTHVFFRMESGVVMGLISKKEETRFSFSSCFMVFSQRSVKLSGLEPTVLFRLLSCFFHCFHSTKNTTRIRFSKPPNFFTESGTALGCSNCAKKMAVLQTLLFFIFKG
jgi:hypothetical protein